MFDEAKKTDSGNLEGVGKKLFIAAMCAAIGGCSLGGVMSQVQMSEAATTQTQEVRAAQTKTAHHDNGKIDVENAEPEDKIDHERHEGKDDDKIGHEKHEGKDDDKIGHEKHESKDDDKTGHDERDAEDAHDKQEITQQNGKPSYQG